jgi:predicted RNA-binding Zn-ribbon protein involved in translation (DUF1610 family)
MAGIKTKGNPNLPICVSCLVVMRCQENGVVVREDHDDPTYWSAGLYECPSCRHQIIYSYSTCGSTDKREVEGGDIKAPYIFRYEPREPTDT